MELGSSVNVTESLYCWSPDGQYLAVVTSIARLVIRNLSNLQVVRSEVVPFSAVSDRNQYPIEKIAFSPDSEFLLAASFRRGVIHVFRVLCSDWKAKITEGPAGLLDIRFAPDSRHLLSFSECNVKLTIWSLSQKRVRYVKFPKLVGCVEFFTKSPHRLAVVERSDNRDHVSIYSCEDWNILRQFDTEFKTGTGTGCSSLTWSPKGDVLCLSSGHLDFECKVYNVSDGRCLLSYTPEDMFTVGMGLRVVEWSPCGSLLVVGGGDSKVRVFNALNWSLLAELAVEDFNIQTKNVHVYEEKQLQVDEIDVDMRIAKEWSDVSSHGCKGLAETEYVAIMERPVQLIVNSLSRDKFPDRFGVNSLQFSPDGLYLSIGNDTFPSMIFIWDVLELGLTSVLVHTHHVVSAQWSPVGLGEDAKLLILTSNSNLLHVWTPKGVACLSLPVTDRKYQANGILWNPKGDALAVFGKSSVIVKWVRQVT